MNAVKQGSDRRQYNLPFYRRRPLHFSCTQCGKCCAGGKDKFVFLCADEQELIRDYLQLTSAWFRKRYLRRLDEDLVLAAQDNGDCIFLREGRCRIYAVRPLQCRSYPFWPEIVKTSKNWARESRHCEGINRGGPVKISVITASIKAILDC